MVARAIMSSRLQILQREEENHHVGPDPLPPVADPAPKDDCPNARRKICSICTRTGDAVGRASGSTDKLVAVLRTGGEGVMFVARNMWYVCRAARMNRHARGMTGRPRRRVRFCAWKAWV